MKKTSLIFLFFLWSFFPLYASGEEIEINSEVMSVSPAQEFFIIKGGEDRGIEIGDGLIVHRNNRKIASAHIIEVRPTVSAAEIIDIKKGSQIREGDSILMVKTPKVPYQYKKPLKPLAKPKSKWTTILGSTAGEPRTLLSKTQPLSATTMPQVTETQETIITDIHRPSNEVFSYIMLILRENGFSIISSNRSIGTILATKPIELSLLKELWADAIAAIDHRLVVSFEIKKNDSSSSQLRVSSFKEHSQKEKYIKQPVTKTSKYYTELVTLVSKIKERAED